MSSTATMIVSTAEEMNPSRRSTMEDCHVTLAPGSWNCPDPDMGYVGVYDGHGGRGIVEFLEDVFAHNIGEELQFNDDADIPTRLERAFLMTDIQSRMAGIMTSGATVALCLIKKNRIAGEIYIYAANVGDARAVLSCTGTTSSQKAYRLTHDHRADDPEEIARIEAAGGFVARSRVLGILAVARSMGDHGMKEFVIGKPFSSVTKVAIDYVDSSQGSPCISSEFVILACDGLWDVMDDQEAVDLVRKSVFGSADPTKLLNLSLAEVQAQKEKMEKAAQILVDTAMQNGSTDNITAVVYWL